MKTFENGSSYPKRYFGLHMAEGVCEYDDPNFKGRVLVLDNALDRMDKTFECKPLFVGHVPKTTPEIASSGDGWVVKSFRNPLDGKRWVEFMAVSDLANQRIAEGWRLSNSYGDAERGPGGRWHNVEYQAEVMNANFRHLALVPDPRYDESIILTPEEFAAYNSRLEAKRAQFSNSQGDRPMKILEKIKFFNRSALPTDKLKDLAGCELTLSNGRTITFEQLLNEADEKKEKKEGEQEMANGEHFVEVGGQKMTVNALMAHYNELQTKASEASKSEAEKEKEHQNALQKAKDDAAATLKAKELEHQNALTAAQKAAEDSAKDAASKKKTFDDLQNANKAPVTTAPVATIDLPQAQVARGMDRYGA